jgi:hypothetical protein
LEFDGGREKRKRPVEVLSLPFPTPEQSGAFLYVVVLLKQEAAHVSNESTGGQLAASKEWTCGQLAADLYNVPLLLLLFLNHY